jgi:hypothetical protein
MAAYAMAFYASDACRAKREPDLLYEHIAWISGKHVEMAYGAVLRRDDPHPWLAARKEGNRGRGASSRTITIGGMRGLRKGDRGSGTERGSKTQSLSLRFSSLSLNRISDGRKAWLNVAKNTGWKPVLQHAER